jgi:hypothetical protein
VVRRIYFLVCTAQAQHFQPLATLKPLQQNLAAIGETYGVSVDKRFRALLDKSDFLYLTYSQMLL